jgi:hypothetical protein
VNRKKNPTKAPAAPAAELPALKVGGRVRRTDDQVEGRIAWANAASVKIKWDDSTQVTWRRDSLTGRPVAVLDADGGAQTQSPGASTARERAGEVEGATAEPTPAAPNPTATGPEGPTAEPTAAAKPPVAAAAPAPAAVVPSSPTDSAAGEAAPAKPRRSRQSPAEPKAKKVGGLDAAARVLAEDHRPLSCREMIAAMAAKGYWSSPGGKTPEATLYSALLRELTAKGARARFTKIDRGKFALRGPE